MFSRFCSTLQEEQNCFDDSMYRLSLVQNLAKTTINSFKDIDGGNDKLEITKISPSQKSKCSVQISPKSLSMINLLSPKYSTKISNESCSSMYSGMCHFYFG
ncbi:Hypothetical_protein [Hexamita inflata]|uniref:Hypothetical_protein n=1 Tax=Hexamita inflata TaxID=28002 RepID=A0AA86UZZ3_9EUKA|nr:Hypothetical protein HINF_LOCUS41538 [Hexamita inflata]